MRKIATDKNWSSQSSHLGLINLRYVFHILREVDAELKVSI